MLRGEIRWYQFASPDKRRPVLILTRNAVINSFNEIIVVPITRTIRGLATEVLLSEDDGMPTACALNLDHVGLAQRARAVARMRVLTGGESMRSGPALSPTLVSGRSASAHLPLRSSCLAQLRWDGCAHSPAGRGRELRIEG